MGFIGREGEHLLDRVQVWGLNCGTEWWEFDTYGIRPSEVAIMCSPWVRASNAVYWLYYTGYISEKLITLSISVWKTHIIISLMMV